MKNYNDTNQSIVIPLFSIYIKTLEISDMVYL